MIHIERGILLKSHVSCNFMLKYYIAISFRQFTKTLNQLSLFMQEKFWTFACLFELSFWTNESNFEVFWLANVFIKGHYRKKCKISCSLKTAMCKHIIFIWLPPTMKWLLKEPYFDCLHTVNFSGTWDKEVSFCR